MDTVRLFMRAPPAPGDPSLIVVVDYDPEWPALFAALKDRAASALGPFAARIEHVGSTAVPGLAAKPIIDMDVLLWREKDRPTAVAALEKIGYHHEGELGIRGREAFRWPEGEPRHHLYLCMPGSEEFRRHVAFRDYLRSHPDLQLAYADLKRRLAERYREDRDAYTEGKTAFIEGVPCQACGDGRSQ